ncbi:MAG: NADH-quinone oxidoreductase subunit N, partial [Phycisphaerae bacterium]
LVLIIPIISPKKNALGVGIAAGIAVFLALACLLTVQSMGALATDPLAGSVGGSYLGGLLVMDPFAWFFKFIVLLFVLIVIGLWSLTTRELMGPGDAPEFFTLLLAATVGICLMGSTSNLLMMFLAIEMASLPSYILAGFRKTERLGAEAALKYVLFGAVCSSIMLYGMSLLYGQFGTLDIARMHLGSLDPQSPGALLVALSLVALLVGIGFKIAMVPMHFWAPDVFEGTHMDVAAFLSVASKAGGLALLLRVVYLLLIPAGATAGPAAMGVFSLKSGGWLAVGILAIGTLTCFWGNLAAFAQNNIKRLLAYSSIAHAGYMLLAIATLVGQTPGRAIEGVLFYLFMYLFINGGAFVVAAAIQQRIGSADIRDYAALGRRSPILAACMVIFVFSLVGIPMTVGFGAKLKLFQIMYDSQHWIGYTALVVLAANTVLAAFYYFRIIKQMYLTTSTEPAVAEFNPTTLLAVMLVVPNVFLFVAYGWVDNQVRWCAQMHTEVVVNK